VVSKCKITGRWSDAASPRNMECEAVMLVTLQGEALLGMYIRSMREYRLDANRV
jgi:hypothetical protein